MNLEDVFRKRVDMKKKTIGFVDFVNCLHIVEFNLRERDSDVFSLFFKN